MALSAEITDQSEDLYQHALHRVAPTTACMAALYVLYMCRMILYFRYHKWLSIMVDTLTISAKQLAHFSPVLLLVCITMVGLSHLFIGPYYLGFSSIARTSASMSNMIVGNWDVTETHAPTYLVVVYELIFFLLMIALLLNLLVAIVVEAFVQVKGRISEVDDDPTYSDFFWDVFVYWPSRAVAFYRNKWPSADPLLTALQSLDLMSDSLVTPQLVASSLPISDASASALLQFYSQNFVALRPHETNTEAIGGVTGEAEFLDLESGSNPEHGLAMEKQPSAIRPKLSFLPGGKALEKFGAPPGCRFLPQ